MKQTAAHRPYVGSAGVLSRRALSPACRRRGHRPGFTLIEVVVAMAILAVVSIAFATFSMASSQRSSQDLIRVKAQNLAEVTMEDLTGLQVSAIKGLMNGTVALVNYPANGTGVTGYTADPARYHVIISGEFLMTGLTSFFGTSGVGLDGSGTAGAVSSLQFSPLDKGIEKNDYYGVYSTSQLPTMSNTAFKVHKYGIAQSMVVEPMLLKDGDTWEAGLIVFLSQFPHFQKEITIVDQTPEVTDEAKAHLTIDVKILWTFGTGHQMLDVNGEKIGIY